MCGIIGTLNFSKSYPIREDGLRQMLAMLRHRGPDQFGLYLDDQVGLGSARLSIIDLAGGQQPVANEDESLWIVFNGEIFNYTELRPELEKRGHRFATNTDTEVILHLYEDYGPNCLQYLNGQFAIALWDSQNHTLFLARDRLGIRPLFYTIVDGALIFASEIKAILADHRVSAELDPIALEQIFTYWSTLSPHTVFRDIFELPPGSYLLAHNGELKVNRYWELEFPQTGTQSLPADASLHRRMPDYLEEFRSLLVDATQIRLRADVPVGAYLSGGLDSSTTAAIIRNFTHNKLDTFSISFSDSRFDESEHQLKMARFLGTDHHVVHATDADIGREFPDVIWHTETPIMRTAPAPLFMLSRLVQEHGYKVVMTGEGADEFLAGYDIFKEAKIRRFWARQPNSRLRPELLKRLYPDISNLSKSGDAYLFAFFAEGLTAVDGSDYSHAIRWHNNSRTKRFFSEDMRQAVGLKDNAAHTIPYPTDFCDWDPLNQAQYLEITIFLSQYLLSSQGDRMSMAHSVEGRYPFLDYRVVEFCNCLPPDLKLHGLTEKYLLRKLAQEWLPEEIWQRPKRPYRAPIHRSFVNEATPDYVRELLSPKQILESGLFDPFAVSQLIAKAEGSKPLSETDEMALVGILSSQLLYWQFLEDFKMPPPLGAADDVKVCVGKQTAR